jgi:hypothetical protein
MSLQLVGRDTRVTFLEVPDNAGASVSKWMVESKSLLVKYPWEDHDNIDDDFPDFDDSYQYIDVITGKLILPFQRAAPKPAEPANTVSDEEKENLRFNSPEKTLEIFKKLGTTFGVCRNPYERLVSFWKKETQKGTTDQDFDPWCSTMVAILAGTRGSETNYLKQNYFLKGCDIILRYENLEQEFQQIVDLVKDDRPFRLLEDDQNQTADFMSYYTPFNRKAISILLHQDFKYLDYEI